MLALATGSRIIPLLVPPARGSEVVEAEQEVLVTDCRRAAGGGHAASSTL